jgi:cell division transport system permease protein
VENIEKNKFILRRKINFVFMLIITVLLFIVFTLFIDNFYKLKKTKVDLSKKVYITIFFNNSANIDKRALSVKIIENTKNLMLKEYVDEFTAYSKAIERNKLLNELYVPGMEKSLQAYAIVIPKDIPDDTFLSYINEKLKKNSNIDEIIYNKDIFNQYVFVSKQLRFYEKILYFYVLLLLIMFVYKCIFLIFSKKIFFIKKMFYYIMYSVISFFILKVVSIFFKYILLINSSVSVKIILFTAIFMIVLDNDDIC